MLLLRYSLLSAFFCGSLVRFLFAQGVYLILLITSQIQKRLTFLSVCVHIQYTGYPAVYGKVNTHSVARYFDV